LFSSLRGTFLFADGAIAGRPMYGSRPDPFVALEDKMVVDDLWDRALVQRAPVRHVVLGGPSLADAAAELDWGQGTIWVGDNREGWHGGAEVLRWVSTPSLAAAAHRYLADRADAVRVMPFLEGIPCSIHGIVTPRDIVTVRPIEILTRRVPSEGILQYVGTAGIYDPPETIRETMRAVAKDVGTVLRSDAGYAGGFTVDGVATVHGFLPTELNSRLGVGLIRATESIDDVWLMGLQRALVAGESLDYRPRDLEQLLVKGADAARNGSAFLMIDAVPDESKTLHLRFDGASMGPIDPDRADATVHWGLGTTAGALKVRIDPDRTRPGVAVGPLVAAALAAAAAHWDLELPEFEPACDVHRL
jgi:hypothetical protein